MVRVVAISQARMTSTRLPGKVLAEVLGRPLLAYHVERLRRVPALDEIVIATTVNDTDDPIVELCEDLEVSVFRGDELDVLGRYHGAATEYGAERVLRITSDCPILDPELQETLVTRFRSPCGSTSRSRACSRSEASR